MEHNRHLARERDTRLLEAGAFAKCGDMIGISQIIAQGGAAFAPADFQPAEALARRKVGPGR